MGRRSHWVSVEVEVDLSEFDDDDLLEEIKRRAISTPEPLLERVYAELTRFNDVPEAIFLIEQELRITGLSERQQRLAEARKRTAYQEAVTQ